MALVGMFDSIRVVSGIPGGVVCCWRVVRINSQVGNYPWGLGQRLLSRLVFSMSFPNPNDGHDMCRYLAPGALVPIGLFDLPNTSSVPDSGFPVGQPGMMVDGYHSMWLVLVSP